MDNLQFYAKYFEDQLKSSGYLKYATTIFDNNFKIGSSKSFFNGVTTTDLIIDQTSSVSISIPKEVFFNNPYIVLTYLADQLKDSCDLYCTNYLHINTLAENVLTYDDVVSEEMSFIIPKGFQSISKKQVSDSIKYVLFCPEIYIMAFHYFQILTNNINEKSITNSIDLKGMEISQIKTKLVEDDRYKSHFFTKDSVIICYKPSLTFTENGDAIDILATNIFGIATPFIDRIIELDINLG